MIVVNFIGGPCAGKTTNAMGLAYQLKRDYVSCTLSLEYIGGLIHSAREEVLKDQAYIFGNQNHNLEILKNKGYDIVVTDASLLNSIIYAPRITRNRSRISYSTCTADTRISTSFSSVTIRIPA